MPPRRWRWCAWWRSGGWTRPTPGPVSAPKPAGRSDGRGPTSSSTTPGLWKTSGPRSTAAGRGSRACGPRRRSSPTCVAQQWSPIDLNSSGVAGHGSSLSRVGSRACRRGATALVALSLLAAACGGGGGKKAVTGQTAGTQAPSEGTPKAGGSLIMGTEAEVDGFDPAKNRWDLTGVTYGLTVYDPLPAF